MTWHYLFWIIKLINLNWNEMKLVVKKFCILDLMFQLTCSKKQRIRQVLNCFFGLTFVGCQKPIDAIVIIRKKTRSECFPKNWKNLGSIPWLDLKFTQPLIAALPVKVGALKPNHFATIEFTPSHPINTFHLQSWYSNKAQVIIQ